MLNKILIGAGAVIIGGYVLWSALGWELSSSKRDPVPTAQAARTSSGSSGRTGGYYGFGRSSSSGRSSGWGGFSFGK